MRAYLSMASRTFGEGGFGFSLDIMRCRLGSRQASSMWDETYIFCPFNHGTKYSSIGFMQFLLCASIQVGAKHTCPGGRCQGASPLRFEGEPSRFPRALEHLHPVHH